MNRGRHTSFNWPSLIPRLRSAKREVLEDFAERVVQIADLDRYTDDGGRWGDVLDLLEELREDL